MEEDPYKVAEPFDYHQGVPIEAYRGPLNVEPSADYADFSRDDDYAEDDDDDRPPPRPRADRIELWAWWGLAYPIGLLLLSIPIGFIMFAITVGSQFAFTCAAVMFLTIACVIAVVGVYNTIRSLRYYRQSHRPRRVLILGILSLLPNGAVLYLLYWAISSILAFYFHGYL